MLSIATPELFESLHLIEHLLGSEVDGLDEHFLYLLIVCFVQ